MNNGLESLLDAGRQPGLTFMRGELDMIPLVAAVAVVIVVVRVAMKVIEPLVAAVVEASGEMCKECDERVCLKIPNNNPNNKNNTTTTNNNNNNNNANNNNNNTNNKVLRMMDFWITE
ncbi:hypothetical protein PoB_001572600 [Plakobranchus ocellatus]|uniref:Uncharacterized protein n=1 Tax=Plakobranchus ocellatus TaxID=259542 RepID=A0AAV3Z077_9GAST|nr:hypothetical protein PoB_001572600 [Plakobranchus ocellatus]